MSDDERRQMELNLMQSKIAQKYAEAYWRDEQRRWEPWKALSAAFAAGVVVATGLMSLAAWVLSHLLH